jgi:O-succinylbenzoic acid--CoA ligase
MDSLSLLTAARDPAVSGRAALITAGARYRFADLAPRVALLCDRLRFAGLGPGSRAALIAKNRLETVLVIYALLEIGAAIVPIHPRLTPPEMTALLEDGSADTLLRDADIDALLDAGCAANPVVIAPDHPSPGDADLFAIVHTSGTTGRPKGAMLPRSAVAASAAASAANLGWEDHDRWLACMPLCHIGGLSIITRCLLARAPLILEPRFEPRAVLDAIPRDAATLLSVVPTMLHALLEEDRENLLARLRVVLLGGAAAPESLLDECARRGVMALTTYGLTEACSQVTSQSPRARFTREPGSGRPLTGVDLRIADASNQPAPPCSIGHIQIRGPTLMRAYWPHGGPLPGEPLPELHRAAWFDTGDLGAIDDEGRLHVYARRTDLIVTGGENVYPIEVERVLEATPGVLRALVFGVPDDRWGHVVAAAVVLDPAAPASEPNLAIELRARLAPHKRPRRLCVVDALPVAASGKLDRSSAAQLFASSLRPFQIPLA